VQPNSLAMTAVVSRGLQRPLRVCGGPVLGRLHRSAGPVDLLIAATAERERLTVLCDDRDFQAIARITGQPVKLVTDI
jgi:predicted nucleic acid-binding protein